MKDSIYQLLSELAKCCERYHKIVLLHFCILMCACCRALKDANKVISLSSDWPKGYFRKGKALAGLKVSDRPYKPYQKSKSVLLPAAFTVDFFITLSVATSVLKFESRKVTWVLTG